MTSFGTVMSWTSASFSFVKNISGTQNLGIKGGGIITGSSKS